MSAQKSAGPDFTRMKDYELITACGDDASLWAAAFCQTAKRLGQEIDEGWMIGWFANAIEASWDKRVNRAEPPTRPMPPDLCVHNAALTMYCPECAKSPA